MLERIEEVCTTLSIVPGNHLDNSFVVRRGGRVVECGGLENRCGGNPTEGSNPSLSAILPPLAAKGGCRSL